MRLSRLRRLIAHCSLGTCTQCSLLGLFSFCCLAFSTSLTKLVCWPSDFVHYRSTAIRSRLLVACYCYGRCTCWPWFANAANSDRGKLGRLAASPVQSRRATFRRCFPMRANAALLGPSIPRYNCFPLAALVGQRSNRTPQRRITIACTGVFVR